VSLDATDIGPRFHMLGSVQELAAERLSEMSNSPDIERRHAEYLRALVEQGDWPAEQQAEWAERLRTDEENLRGAVRWFFTNDIAPLPHLFRVLWLYWQMHDRLPEGRAWIEALSQRTGQLDEQARAELLVVSAITAVEVGDDTSALATLEGLERLEGRIHDASLESAAQLAIAWVLPIVDDPARSLTAASEALAGFRQRNDPLMAWAALTVGLLEMTLGRFDAARSNLVEARELGGRFGNTWLESSTRTLLASLAVKTAHLDEGRALLAESVAAPADTELSTQSLTFSLVTYAELAVAKGQVAKAATALGAAEGLRNRVGLRTWPSMRSGESAIVARVKEAVDPGVFDAAFASGSQFTRRQALTFVRDGATSS
jgi:hypothetical protein